MFEYVRDKYGKDYVGQIATFAKIKARSAIRDLARVLEIPYEDADAMAKCVPQIIMDEETGERETDVDLADALEESAELREWQKKYPELFEYAFKIEGLWRQSGIHAAGIVISPVPLADYVPLARNTTHDLFPALQLDMDAVEDLGLVKMDFLGLKTLDVMKDTIDWIGIDIDWRMVKLDDPKVYDLLKTGKTLGVFQVESHLFRDLIRKMQPDNFEDIAALIALGRPGPLDAGMDKVYISNKHGYTNIEYLHPDLEDILKDTFGIIVYQEQVLSIVKKFAKFEPLEADHLRKIIGKKIAKEINAQGEKFISQAVDVGYDRQMLETLWHQIETFARYGLN